MTVLIDDYEQLTDVVGWVYRKNAWGVGQSRIVISSLGDVNYRQLLNEKLHLRFPVIVDVSGTHITTYFAPSAPIRADLRYDDWDDLFN